MHSLIFSILSSGTASLTNMRTLVSRKPGREIIKEASLAQEKDGVVRANIIARRANGNLLRYTHYGRTDRQVKYAKCRFGEKRHYVQDG